jgi:SAM-dependent methyltransferase
MLYNYPQYYDLLFGSDWKAEFDFLRGCFACYARRPVKRVFEPACGTGRLLVKLAQAGYRVAGNDINDRAIEFCNARLRRYGFPASAKVGDMTDFRLKRPVDAAFNMINSFRHLSSEAAATAHLRCMADCVATDGLYVLGLHLTPAGTQVCDEESWSARRGHLAVTSRMQSLAVDRRTRREHIAVTCDIYTPTRHQRMSEEMIFRTYTLGQFKRLLLTVPEFEVAATFDFAYDLETPIEVDPSTEDVVWVLRRRR